MLFDDALQLFSWLVTLHLRGHEKPVILLRSSGKHRLKWFLAPTEEWVIIRGTLPVASPG
jgi:hypothetical protein